MRHALNMEATQPTGNGQEMSPATAVQKHLANFVDEAIEDIAPEMEQHRQILIWSALRSTDALLSATARRWLADKRSFQSETRPPPLAERLRDLYLSGDAKSMDDIIGATMAYGSVTAGFSFPTSTLAQLTPAVAGASAPSAAAAAAQPNTDKRTFTLPAHQAAQLVAAAAIAGAELQFATGADSASQGSHSAPEHAHSPRDSASDSE